MSLNRFAQTFVSAALVALLSGLVFPLAVSAHNNVVVMRTPDTSRYVPE